MVDSALQMGASLVGLVVAAVLLIEVVSLRKVMLGVAVAEKISYVYLAILCLAASAIAQWSSNFVAGVTLEQMRLASELLVVVAMALLALYFYSVRSAMQRFMTEMTGAEILHSESAEGDGGASA